MKSLGVRSSGGMRDEGGAFCVRAILVRPHGAGRIGTMACFARLGAIMVFGGGPPAAGPRGRRAVPLVPRCSSLVPPQVLPHPFPSALAPESALPVAAEPGGRVEQVR